MSSFSFLGSDFPEIYVDAAKAERLALSDPRTSCFYARRVVESAVTWAFNHDSTLKMPYEIKISALLHEPTFQSLTGDKIFKLAKEIVRLGNRAVHDKLPPSEYDSVASVSHLFQFTYWFARTYSRGEKPAAGLTFDPRLLPRGEHQEGPSSDQLKELEAQLEADEVVRKATEVAAGVIAEIEAERDPLTLRSA